MVSELLTVKFLVLYTFIASALYIHYRGKEKLKFTRQLTDHSTIMAPYNAIMYLFSRVPTQPVLNAQLFPELSILKDNWQTIRKEAIQLHQEGFIAESEGYNDLAFNSFFRRGWKRFYLKWYRDYHPSAEKYCPKTTELLRSIPTINAAMFTLLPAHSELVRHRDPFAGSLRYHLGLITPNSDECHIYVDGTPYAWNDGEELVFDETYIHKAENKTDIDRLILFCDVERPLKYRVLSILNKGFGKFIGYATSTKNMGNEKVGFLNKAFSYVYYIRIGAKRIKAYNQKFYYLLKYSLMGLLLYWIFV